MEVHLKGVLQFSRLKKKTTKTLKGEDVDHLRTITQEVL